jgi:hypothetical protein
MRGLADDLRPLPIDVLCRAIGRIVREPAIAPIEQVLTGRALWRLGNR